MLGVDSADTVSAAGGLVCDSVRAGLRVEVYLETLDDGRALQILGVEAGLLPEAFDVVPEPDDAIYVAAALHERHRGVRRLVSEAARRRVAVATWGTGSGTDTEHRLSAAAQAFKFHAIKASGAAMECAPVESFVSRAKRS